MNLSKRIEKLEKRNGFNSERERKKYIQYAKKLNENINPDDIRSPKDYLELLSNHLKPLP